MYNKKIEKLIGSLMDINSHERRSSAAKVLGEIGNASAVKPLINALGDWCQDVREKAVEALGKIRDMRAIEPLVQTLGDKENYVRRRAAWALGEIGSARAVEALIKALEDGDSDVRKISVEALGKIGNPQTVEILIQVLENDQRSDVRRSAAEVLDKLNWSPVSDTETVHYYIAKRDWGKVVSLGTPAVEPLIKLLVNEDCVVRNKTVWALEDWVVRLEAVWALGEISDVRAIKPLIHALEDSNYDVQTNAVEALAKIGKPAVEPLIRILDSNSGVRGRASKSLVKIGASAVEPLIRAIGDRDSDVRKEVAETLDKLHWSPANDTEKAYYLAAKQDWESVILLGTPAVEPLTRLLGDKDSNIKNKATELLEKFCSQITEIIFGEISSNNNKTCVKNPETSQLTIPMSSLTKIHINTDTYDFDMVERFITYAINYVGQKHLKKKVEVYIYGNPKKLHPNLLNSFKNLCRKVIIQGKE